MVRDPRNLVGLSVWVGKQADTMANEGLCSWRVRRRAHERLGAGSRVIGFHLSDLTANDDAG
jgi:hypothetical protein